MRRDFAVLAWTGCLAATNVFHLLRLQRTTRVILHRRLPL
jgi:hypothetical protein